MTEYVVRIPAKELPHAKVAYLIKRALDPYINSRSVEVMHLVSDPEMVIHARAEKVRPRL